MRSSFHRAWLASLPTLISASAACGTFVHTKLREQTLQDFNEKKKTIDEKLKYLYGPLYGNRLIYQSLIDGVEDFHGKSIEKHIRDICDKQDAELLEDWRGYYKRNIAVLDKKALDIIQKNSHLIHDDDSRRKLQSYLTETSRKEYVMEIWRDGDKWDSKHDYNKDDWVPENNNGDFSQHEKLGVHIRETHRYLYEIRAEIDRELSETYSGIESVDQLIRDVPRKKYKSLTELDESNFMETEYNTKHKSHWSFLNLF